VEKFQHDSQVVNVVLASMAEAIIVWSASQTVSGCNPAAEQIFGRPREQLLGLGAAELKGVLVDRSDHAIAPNDAPVARAFRSGEPVEDEIGIRRATGERTWLRESCRLMRSEAGALLGAVSTLVEVTALRENSLRLQEIVAGANVGTWQLNRRTGEATRSDRWFELLQLERGDVEPTFVGLRARVHPDDAPQFDKIPAAWDAGGPFLVEVRLRTGGGEWKWCQIRGSTQLGDRSQVSGVLVDVDRRKRTELALENALAENVRLVAELQATLSKVQALEGLLPICMYCKCIRDDDNWVKLEQYISRRSRARFSHGICPGCYLKHHPDEQDE
jgi:PAS domain S-box-containing protein